MITEQNLPGTHIPQMSNELFVRKQDDSVFAQKKVRSQLVKILADTELGDNRGDVCTDPSHKHPKEWHHGVSYPESGGIFTYHLSFPYPEKGARDDLMMMSIQFVKRMLINWVRFLAYALTHFYRPSKVLEKFLIEFCDYAEMVDNHGKHFMLEKRYYSAQGRELMKGIYIFLVGMGISNKIADKFSHVFIALVDPDTAYYYRVADILSEANKERMLKNPTKEILFLMKTFAEREDRPHLVAKFRIFAQGLRIALWIPKYHRAFKKAIEEIDFTKIGLDEADKYHVRNRGGYNYFGRTLEDRLKEWPLTQHTYGELTWKK